MEPDTLAQRLVGAVLGLQAQMGVRKLTNAAIGEMLARVMQRPEPFAPNTVRNWLAGVKVPDLDVIEAFALLTGRNPGVLAFGAAAEDVGVRRIDPALYQQLTGASTPRLPVANKNAARKSGRRRSG